MKVVIALFLGFLPLAAQSLPNAVPMPTPEIQYLDSTGAPLAGAKLCTFAAGTSTPLATYTDSTAGTPNTNPIILDVNGRASVWIGPQLYKFVLLVGGDGTCATGTVQWTQDNVTDTTLYFTNFVKTAGTATLITYTAPLGGTPPAVQTTVAAKLAETVSLLDFGAVPDNSTDNSTVLQAALDYGAANRVAIHCTPGVYNFSTGLNMTGPVTIYGDAPGGKGSCVLMYTGAATALTINNSISTINGVNMRNIIIAATNSAPATEGIFAKNLGHAVFDHVSVGAGFTTGNFTTLWELKEVGFAQIIGPTMSNNNSLGTAFLLDDYNAGAGEGPNAEIEIYQGDFFGLARDIEVNSCYRCHFHDNHMENQDYGFIMDASHVTNLVDVTELHIDDNYFLSNGSGSHKQFLAGLSAPAKIFNAPSITVNDNQLELVSGGVATPLYFATAVGGTAIVNLWITNNYMDAVLTSVLAADSPSVIAYFTTPIYALDGSALPVAHCSGSGLCPFFNLTPQNEVIFKGNMSVGDGAPGTAPTTTFELQGSTVTQANVTAGSAQGFNPLVQYKDHAGNIVGNLRPDATPSWTLQNGPWYYNVLANGPRWHPSLQNAESTGNAGSDYTLNAYDDSGNYLSTPLIITRKTGTTAICAIVGAHCLLATNVDTGSAANIQMFGEIQSDGVGLASLGTATAGLFVYCPDCAPASNPCSAGAGAWAFANGTAWKCPF